MMVNGRYVDDSRVWEGLWIAEQDLGFNLENIKRVLDQGGDVRDCAIVALEYLARGAKHREIGLAGLRGLIEDYVPHEAEVSL